jgi:hypothetical protein
MPTCAPATKVEEQIYRTAASSKIATASCFERGKMGSDLGQRIQTDFGQLARRLTLPVAEFARQTICHLKSAFREKFLRGKSGFVV